MHDESKTLCWKCENAYGGCEWTEVDPETGLVRFGDVPGWTVSRRYGKNKVKGKSIKYERVSVIKCPKFRNDIKFDKWEAEQARKKKAYDDAVAERKAKEEEAKRRILEMI